VGRGAGLDPLPGAGAEVDADMGCRVGVLDSSRGCRGACGGWGVRALVVARGAGGLQTYTGVQR
jgi:hypothetical protein